MNDIGKAFFQAISIIGSGDRETFAIIFLSLKVSLSALLLGALIAIPFGTILGLKKFPGKRLLVNITYTLIGLPPVLAGLLLYLLLSNSGPMGKLNWLFTPQAMVIVQTILVMPIITGLTMVGVMSKRGELSDVTTTLGANPRQVAFKILVESRRSILAALITGFGRIVGEVGAVTLVGGDIEGSTRVMTTSIVLETRKGNFDRALALGMILLLISFVINMVLHTFQEVGNNERTSF